MNSVKKKNKKLSVAKKKLVNQDSEQVVSVEVKTYFWYKDRATLIALISGFFSTLVTTLNIFLR